MWAGLGRVGLVCGRSRYGGAAFAIIKRREREARERHGSGTGDETDAASPSASPTARAASAIDEDEPQSCIYTTSEMIDLNEDAPAPMASFRQLAASPLTVMEYLHEHLPWFGCELPVKMPASRQGLPLSPGAPARSNGAPMANLSVIKHSLDVAWQLRVLRDSIFPLATQSVG